MESLYEAAKAHANDKQLEDIEFEQRLMIAFSAGAIFGANQVEAAVEAKYIIMKTNKQDKS